MQIIFPNDPMAANKVDAFFQLQAEALSMLGGSPALYSLEDGRVFFVREGETLLYRGWMLDMKQYEQLEAAVASRGAKLLVDTQRYLNTHHLPNWYPFLQGMTPDTLFIQNRDMENDRQWTALAEVLDMWGGKVFLKDYVKSLKTGRGSVASSVDEIKETVKQMIQYRGGLEGGLCIRKYENLKFEYRHFIANKQVFSPKPVSGMEQTLLELVSARIDSPFYSVDIADDSYGCCLIVEIGDGQVSDLVGWTPKQFEPVIASLK